jgi:hypothetical protein
MDSNPNSIVNLVKEYGVKNLRFYIPMRRLEFAGIIPGIAFTSSTSEEEVVLCNIDEVRYKIKDDYKITLTANDPRYGKNHFYISDLHTLFSDSRRENDGRFRCYVETIDGYTEVYPGLWN